MILEQANEELIFFIEKYPLIIDWDSLFENYLFSEEYIINNIKKIFLSSYDDYRINTFLSNQIITENTLNEMIKYQICFFFFFFDRASDFVEISANPNLTIDFFEKYFEFINWITFSNAPRILSIIDKYEDYIDWYTHSEFVLPEVFEKYKDKIDIT